MADVEMDSWMHASYYLLNHYPRSIRYRGAKIISEKKWAKKLLGLTFLAAAPSFNHTFYPFFFNLPPHFQSDKVFNWLHVCFCITISKNSFVLETKIIQKENILVSYPGLLRIPNYGSYLSQIFENLHNLIQKLVFKRKLCSKNLIFWSKYFDRETKLSHLWTFYTKICFLHQTRGNHTFLLPK